MKKIDLTAALLMGFAMCSYAQNNFFGGNQTEEGDQPRGGLFVVDDQPQGGGLFGYGSTPDGQMRGWSDDGFLFFPSHASWGNWNSDPDGWTDYPPDPEVPLGSSALWLIGFGAAYALKKKFSINSEC